MSLTVTRGDGTDWTAQDSSLHLTPAPHRSSQLSLHGWPGAGGGVQYSLPSPAPSLSRLSTSLSSFSPVITPPAPARRQSEGGRHQTAVRPGDGSLLADWNPPRLTACLTDYNKQTENNCKAASPILTSSEQQSPLASSKYKLFYFVFRFWSAIKYEACNRKM